MNVDIIEHCIAIEEQTDYLVYLQILQMAFILFSSMYTKPVDIGTEQTLSEHSEVCASIFCHFIPRANHFRLEIVYNFICSAGVYFRCFRLSPPELCVVRMLLTASHKFVLVTQGSSLH